MSDMKCLIKCPICGEVLQKYGEIDPDAGTSIVLGANCRKCSIGNSDIKLWQELIRTRKALDVALDTMNYIQRTNPISFHFEAIAKAFAEIKTALEQKD